MDNSLLELTLIIAGIFSFLGAIAAYLISYNEYAHHFGNTKRTMKIALESAIVAFIVLFLLTFACTFFIIST